MVGRDSIAVAVLRGGASTHTPLSSAEEGQSGEWCEVGEPHIIALAGVPR